MKRSDIITVFRSKVETLGYSFLHGFPYRINEGVNSYPLFWLCPPVFRSITTNSNESYTIYHIEAYIHHLNRKFTEDEKEVIWQQQEDIAKSLIISLPDDTDIMYAVSLRCEPDEFKFSADGTISSKITFDIQIYDCKE